MKVFVVNLEKDTEKKKLIEKQCKRQGFDFEIIKAVNGNELSKETLSAEVYEYGKEHLTKGEIGCALSHKIIYKKIADENLDFALILEDDAIINEKTNNLFKKLEKIIDRNKNQVLLMQKSSQFFLNRKIKIDAEYEFYEAWNPKCTHGYMITNKAAKTILKINTPIIREADHWLSFYQLSLLKVYCLNKNLITSRDEDKEASNIEKERRMMTKEQIDYKNSLLDNKINYRLIKIYHKYIRRIFLKKHNGYI